MAAMSSDTSDPQYDEAKKHVEARMGFFWNLGVFVVINVVFLIVAGVDWLWVTFFWGIGLAIHAWAVFFAGSDRVEAWKERQIQRELGKGTPSQPDPEASTGSNDPTVA
jgi:hypothetical protein